MLFKLFKTQSRFNQSLNHYSQKSQSDQTKILYFFKVIMLVISRSSVTSYYNIYNDATYRAGGKIEITELCRCPFISHYFRLADTGLAGISYISLSPTKLTL